MKVYKIEIMVLDRDNIGEQSIKGEIENTKYSNRCISPKVKRIESREIGEWRDNHPLNIITESNAEYQRLFSNPINK